MALKEAIRDKSFRTTEIDPPDPRCVKEPVTFDKHYSPRPALAHRRADAKALISCVTDPGVCAGEAGTAGCVYVNQCNCFVSQWVGVGGRQTRWRVSKAVAQTGGAPPSEAAANHPWKKLPTRTDV